MPVPDEIRDGPYLLVGQFAKTVGPAGADTSRAAKQNRQFHAYLELYFQGKHDGAVRTYCSSQRPPIKCRSKDGSQVVYEKRQTMEQFYHARATTACNRVAKHISDTWKNAPSGNHGTFVRGAKNIMAVQGEKQPDGHGYDLSFWYCGSDIYVTFHCYPK
jgi:hypothetical protein